MQKSVLLSIKPEFAEKIFTGLKTFEFRRVIFKSPSVSRVVVYASSPIQRVIGEFQIGEILSLRKRRLWEETEKGSGIEKSYFDKYFSGKESGFAIQIRSPRRYNEPKRLNEFIGHDRPPQSFRYLAA
jgi:predicted transcriptional regulator